MAQRITFKPTVPITSGGPTGGGGTGAAQLLSGLGDAATTVLSGMFDRAEDQAVADALKRGTDEGDKLSINELMLFRPDKVNQAYVRAATSAASNSLELRARTNMLRISQEHENDPEAMGAAMASFGDGLLQGIPDEIQTPFRAKFSVLAQPYIKASIAKRAALVEQQAKDSFTALENEASVAAYIYGQHASTGPVAPEAIEALTVVYRDNIARYNNAILNAGMAPATALIAVQSTQTRMAKQFVLGAASAAGTVADQEAFLLKYMAGEIAIPLPTVQLVKHANGTATLWTKRDDSGRPILTRQVVSTMLDSEDNAEVRKEISDMIAARRNIESRQKEELREATTKDMIDRSIAGDLTMRGLRAVRENVSVSDFRSLAKSINAKEPEADDPDTVTAMEMLSDDGDWDEVDRLALRAFSEGKLTGATMRLYRRNSRTLKAAAPDNNYKQGMAIWAGVRGEGGMFREFNLGARTMGRVRAGEGQFQRWYFGFRETIDPKTGQPIGRDPTFPETMQVMFRVMKTALRGSPKVVNDIAAVVFNLPENLPRRTEEGRKGEIDATKARELIVKRYDALPPNDILNRSRAVDILRRLELYGAIMSNTDALLDGLNDAATQ